MSHEISPAVERLLERLNDYDGWMRDKYGGILDKYRESKGFRRAIMKHRYPEVANYFEYVDAQQSISDALRSAQANEGRIIIH
jgi:hypothetical protein